MLRLLNTTEQPEEGQPTLWRVSCGSAAVLGLAPLRMETAPTTAYLMLGERCAQDCAFCAQARSSAASEAALSRVTWPLYDAEAVCQATAAAFARGEIQRACFQVTTSPGYLDATRDAVAALAATTDVPICASVAPRSLADVRMLLEAGAQRVTIALDAANERVYRETKTGDWARTWGLLLEAARAFPGRLGTHLIVGLGETEREMTERIQAAHDEGIAVALFAFTPVLGTRLAHQQPPELAHYRRMQAARWLIVQGLARAEAFAYDTADRLTSYGMPRVALAALLAEGDAFRTSGCPGCNRPYYNERPGGVMYNYPRPLTPEEAERAVALLP